MDLRWVDCSPAGGEDSVYRIWATGGEGDFDVKHRCERDKFLEIGPFELLSAGTRKALNASVPAEGRGEEIGRLPRFARNDMLPRWSDLWRKTRAR
jgi:hypothetical protein